MQTHELEKDVAVRRFSLQTGSMRSPGVSFTPPHSNPLQTPASFNFGVSGAVIQRLAVTRAFSQSPSFAGDALLTLQRQHGNSYVQRVLAQARQNKLQRDEDSSGGGGDTPDLPSPEGKSVTCSVDLVKVAAALGGDKSAAIDILNCCESGIGPLPAGCTKTVIDGLRKLLGRKPAETSHCPPGFHAGKSTTYKGQCCSDNTSIESAQNCCPANRASMMGNCCPEGQTAQGLGCAASQSAPAPQMDDAPPSEPGDYELPNNQDTAVA